MKSFVAAILCLSLSLCQALPVEKVTLESVDAAATGDSDSTNERLTRGFHHHHHHGGFGGGYGGFPGGGYYGGFPGGGYGGFPGGGYGGFPGGGYYGGFPGGGYGGYPGGGYGGFPGGGLGGGFGGSLSQASASSISFGGGLFG